MSPLYLYAVLAEAPEARLEGLAGEPMRFLPCQGLLAAVGEVAAAPAVEASALRGHDAAVRRLAAATPALLPARFGSVAADEAALCDALRPRAAALAAALESVRGCDQMTLRFSTLGTASAPEAAAGTERSPAGGGESDGPGIRYLRGRRAAAGDPRQRPEVARVLDALAPLVRGERRESHERPPLVASVYHLVRRDEVEEYRSLLAAATAGSAVRVTSSGPWPPYAFAADELG
jgi:gas vesicle protein GvpL/GvpF